MRSIEAFFGVFGCVYVDRLMAAFKKHDYRQADFFFFF